MWSSYEFGPCVRGRLVTVRSSPCQAGIRSVRAGGLAAAAARARVRGIRSAANVYERALRFIVRTRACDVKAARRVARRALKEGDAL